MARSTWDLVRPGDVLATAPEVLHAGDFYLVLGPPEVNPLPYGWGVIARWPVRVVPRGEGEPWEDTLGAGVADPGQTAIFYLDNVAPCGYTLVMKAPRWATPEARSRKP